MTIKTPVKGLSAAQLYQINQSGTNGWYPIGRDNFWHGGVNVNFTDEETGSKPIRAIANGKIIAYRFTDDFFPLTKTYDEGKDKNLKYYARDYSHNFVLIRHRHEPPNSPAIEYYSLYMHLAPFKVYDAKYDKNEVSIFKRWECQIKTPPAFTGNSLRNASGDIIRIIPWGGAVSIVEEEGVLYNGEAMPNTRKKAVCTLWGSPETGFIWIADFNQTTWRCTSRGRTARNADKGALVHRTADPTSEVIRILPAGTRIYFEEPYQSVSKEGTIRPGMAGIKLDLESPVLGYIDVTTSTIETVGKVIDPVLSDEMQPCEIDVHAGEIIGWPGKDGVCANNSFHFEIFAKDEHVNGSNGFWEIESDQGQPDGVYKIAKDTPFFRMKKNDPVANKTIPKHTILELVGAVDSYGSFPKANARQIKVVNSQVGWVLKDEIGWLSATGSNVGEAKYHLANDALRWFWKQKPTTSTSAREIYMGLRKTYQGNNVELVLEEEGTAGTVQIRKIRYTLTPTLHFNGWVANENSIAGKSYTDNGVKKKRFYATEDITAVYNRNPEYAVFQPSSQKAAHDIYIFKKDCIQAKDSNGDVWTGFPKPFIQSGEIFFDKEEFDEIENWVWLKGDESAFTKMNIFDWNEFFQQCSENAFTGGEDGFCDAVTVFEFIDADKDGTFTDCEIKNAVGHATVKHQLRRLVCEYPSSWFLPSSAANKDSKWGNRLKGPRTNPDEPWYQQVYNRIKEWKDGAKPPRYGFNFSEEKYAAFLELVEKTCFLQQIDGFTEDETLWHFHPIAFVQHLKRLLPDGMSLEEAKKLAVIGTSIFEGAWNKAGDCFNYGVLASNFDAAGLSMGLLQWNIKSRNFFTKLNEMYNKNPSKFKECYEKGESNRFKKYFHNKGWDSRDYKKIWEFDTFTEFIDDNDLSNLNHQFLWAKLLHDPEKIKVTNSNDKYRGWIKKNKVSHSSALRDELLDFFNALGEWHEFQEIQYKHASEGKYMNKAIAEIKWLREKTVGKFPDLMKNVEIRTFVAMFDLCVQHGSLDRKSTKDNIVNSISSKDYSNQHDFMEMVVKERAKAGSEKWQNNSASRRMGFLNAKKTTVSDLGGDAYTVENINYEKMVDNKIIYDFY